MSASRVPKRASLELQHGLRKVKPRYYDALLSSPPPPSLVRLPQVRPASDLPTKTSTKRLQPAPIVWETEDRVRLQFYKDHPWERARAKIVTELDMVGAGWKGKARGLDWTELKQRSRNPTPDDAVEYIVHLHDVHSMTLKHAYQSGIAQFRALRASHEQATKSAHLEASHYGADFSTFGSLVEAGVRAENKYLKKWNQTEEAGATARAAQRLLNPAWRREEVFSAGQDYLKPATEDSEAGYGMVQPPPPPTAREAARAAAIAEVKQVLARPRA